MLHWIPRRARWTLFALAMALLPLRPEGAPARSQALPAAASAPRTFTNPLIPSQATADPWIFYKGGFYYYTFTAGGHIEIWKSPTITGLEKATRATVWRAPPTGPNSRDVWAPEIHFVRGKWYIYYTATTENRSDANRRIFALEAVSDDPQGEYRDRGKVAVPDDDAYAIDGSIFEDRGELYFLWSGRVAGTGPQNIYIAPMSNPWTISGPRVLLSTPRYDWEKVGWHVNEGPQVLQKNGKTSIVYSASGGTTPDYSLGLLTNTDGNFLNAASWTKSPVPIFYQYSGPDGTVYTPGHNGFTRSPDGTEDWIVYHGKDRADNTWRDRTARAQRFHWNPDNTPNFGHPIPPGVRLAVPSGEPGNALPSPTGKGTGLLGKYFKNIDITGLGLTRTDGSVHFDWRLDAPAPALPKEGFSVRWRGQVQPRYSEDYTFQTYATGEVRVWVDGKRILDSRVEAKAATAQGRLTLTAGRKYDIRIDYHNPRGRARLSLFWSSPRQPFEVIPQSRLYPPGTPGPRPKMGRVF